MTYVLVPGPVIMPGFGAVTRRTQVVQPNDLAWNDFLTRLRQLTPK